MPTPSQLLTDPDWLPHRVDVRSGAMRFVRVSRDAQRTITFLADEYLPADAARADLGSPDVARIASSGTPHFIFHSAFCCSTVLVRALDVPGRVFGLKEPVVLNDLAAAQLMSTPAPRVRELLDRTLSLLARTATPGEAIVIKPSNVANGLLDLCLELRPASRAVLMHSPLRSFLRSIARKGLWGRGWARQLYQMLQPVALLDPGYSADELFRQTDLQIAALCWLMHRAQFASVLARDRDHRVRSLEATVLLQRPVEALLAVAELFGIELTTQQATAIAAGPAFTEHSKSLTTAFDRQRRDQEHALTDAAHGAEIDMVVGWAEQVARHCGVPLTLGSPLLPP